MKSTMNSIFLLVIFTTFLSLAPIGPCFGDNHIIRAKGAHTLANPVQKIADAFMKENPDITVVCAAGGSTTGIRALLNKEIELALVVRQLNQEEMDEAKANGLKPKSMVVGHDGVAIVVNPANAVNELTLDQISKIFQGGIESWKELGGGSGPISIYLADPSRHGTPGFFRKTFMSGKPYSNKVTIKRDWALIIDDVKNDKNGMGFCLTQKALEAEAAGDIKTVPIKETPDSLAVKMSWDTITSGLYPLKRPVYFIWDENSETPELKKFMEYCINKKIDLTE